MGETLGGSHPKGNCEWEMKQYRYMLIANISQTGSPPTTTTTTLTVLGPDGFAAGKNNSTSINRSKAYLKLRPLSCSWPCWTWTILAAASVAAEDEERSGFSRRSMVWVSSWRCSISGRRGEWSLTPQQNPIAATTNDATATQAGDRPIQREFLAAGARGNSITQPIDALR